MMADIDDKTKQNGEEKTHTENVEKATKVNPQEVSPQEEAKKHFKTGSKRLSEEQYQLAIIAFEAAINKFVEAEKINNNYFDDGFIFEAYFWQSWSFLQIRDYQKAIKTNQMAVQRAKNLGDNTKSAQVYLLWADILFKMKAYDEAFEKLNNAIENNDNYAPSYHNIIVYYWAQGNYKSAREKLEKAMAIYPKYIEIEEGKQPQGEDHSQVKISKIKKIQSDYLSYGNFILSFWAYSGKNINDAKGIYLDGLGLDPNNVEILIALVRLYIQE